MFGVVDFHEIIGCITSALEERDYYTEGHSQRVSDMVLAFAEIAEIVLHHHERFDGLGYPDGISGYNIPLGSRLIAVCDSIDAMMTTRSYRKAFSEQDCYEEIKRCSGTRYDPDVVDAVMTHWKELMKVAGYNL